MSSEAISQEAARFVAQHLHTVERLEIFLAIANNPLQAKSAHAIFQIIQSSEMSISTGLETFFKAGFLMLEEDGFYRLSDQMPQLPEIAAELDKAYRERHLTIIELIYKKSPAQVQSFADAFRLRKDK